MDFMNAMYLFIQLFCMNIYCIVMEINGNVPEKKVRVCSLSLQL